MGRWIILFSYYTGVVDRPKEKLALATETSISISFSQCVCTCLYFNSMTELRIFLKKYKMLQTIIIFKSENFRNVQ